MPTEFCPDCEMPIRIAIPWIGQRVACPYCSVSLLVTDVTPLEFVLGRQQAAGCSEGWWQKYDNQGKQAVIHPEGYKVEILIWTSVIFFARVIDVGLGTIRVQFIVRRKKIPAALIGFVEVLIFILIVSRVIQEFSIGPTCWPMPVALQSARCWVCTSRRSFPSLWSRLRSSAMARGKRWKQPCARLALR